MGLNTVDTLPPNREVVFESELKFSNMILCFAFGLRCLRSCGYKKVLLGALEFSVSNWLNTGPKIVCHLLREGETMFAFGSMFLNAVTIYKKTLSRVTKSVRLISARI
jgi:hypothetical protein